MSAHVTQQFLADHDPPSKARLDAFAGAFGKVLQDLQSNKTASIDSLAGGVLPCWAG